jgi:3-dehydroquinate dehydratase-2
MTTREILVLHGPNLNMLGRREPETYGHTTLAMIDAALTERAAAAGVPLRCFQSNHEGELVDYGLSLRDALGMLSAPIIEVHLSNVYKREPFRHTSVVAPVVTGQIAGLGWRGYVLALEWLLGQY